MKKKKRKRVSSSFSSLSLSRHATTSRQWQRLRACACTCTRKTETRDKLAPLYLYRVIIALVLNRTRGKSLGTNVELVPILCLPPSLSLSSSLSLHSPVIQHVLSYGYTRTSSTLYVYIYTLTQRSCSRKTTSLPLGHNGALSLGIMHSTGVTNFFLSTSPPLPLSFFVPFCAINWERLGDGRLIFLIRCRRPLFFLSPSSSFFTSFCKTSTLFFTGHAFNGYHLYLASIVLSTLFVYVLSARGNCKGVGIIS